MIPTMTIISEKKIEIVANNKTIENAGDAASNDQILSKTNNESIFDSLFDASLSTIPIFMKYFACHEVIVLICGGIYYLQSDFGVLCLSILPGLSIISIFLHFFITQFNKKDNQIKSTFFSMKHYSVALMVFLVSLSSIIAIYHVNTYLSFLIPTNGAQISSSPSHAFIREILKFPHRHSIKPQQTDEFDFANRSKFNYRISFVGSIIAPIIEESFKFLLISLTFPVSFIWSFCRNKHQNNDRNKKERYIDYCIKSLFVMFIGLCGGCGIAIMENIGYLAACQWDKTRAYCLPNRNFDILGAGLARGIFSVPFHCVTACIMADILCMWMNTNIKCFDQNKILHVIKLLLSYPISIIIPVFLHSSFNYWMKGIPFITGFVTIIGFTFVCHRITKKHAFINNNDDDAKDKNSTKRESITDSIDISIVTPVAL